ncbi:MAG TPA: alpha/beta hydrolase [Spirochaetia bacterium]|nr:alpha/beta hydrolase [Spirochaetales bacterium]HRY80494.1 alpha/beta hydrolase [Spirochaetia bacterium]HRZ88300.1 alpha/beta hydrolase [Spirochaetia bacterium]
MAKCANLACAGLLVAVCALGCVSDEREPPTPWSRWTEIDGTPVHYIDTAPGSDLPALLIVPGYLGSGATFRNFISLLQPGFRIVLPEMPGFGYSPPPPGPCSLDRMTKIVEGVVLEAGLENISLIGSSMGSLIAVRLAVDRPDRIDRIVLLSPFGAGGQADVAARLDRLNFLLPAASVLARKQIVARQIRKQVRDPAELTPEMIDCYARPFRTREGRRLVVEITRDVIGECTFDDRLPLVRQPVLVIAGTEDRLMDSATLTMLQTRVPRCSILRLEGCRHLVYLDAPAQVAELVVAFCERE